LWLLKHLGLETINPVTKKESADATVLTLSKGKNPIIDQLLVLRKLKKKAKSIEGYIEDVKRDGKIHCNFNCSNVRTGRLSSSGPNLQQVDRGTDIRELFIADEGSSLVIGDMAQIEVRMAAHYSKDATLMAMFEREEDFYGTIAVEVLNSAFLPNEVKEKDPVKRKVAKVIGLSILYGVGPNKLKNFIKEQGGVDFSHTEIRQIINKYFERFSGLKQLQMGVHRKCETTGTLLNLYKRTIDISKADIFMKGVNSLLQSSASDLLLFKQLEVEEKAPWAKLLLVVHDEFVIQCPKGREEELIGIIRPIMENVVDIGFRVPLKTDISYGKDWSCKK
jgi:DNA polymerase-1